MEKEIYISVDIEASGPVPGTYSMLALGACVVGNEAEQFYAELQPMSDHSIPGAMAVVGRTLEDFRRTGKDPAKVMSEFGEWITQVNGDRKPVFVGFNASFDWSFINWYFDKYHIENPFGIGALDIKSFYMGLSGCTWGETRSSQLPVKYRSGVAHTHDALSDALEQAGIFERMARAVGINQL